MYNVDKNEIQWWSFCIY